MAIGASGQAFPDKNDRVGSLRIDDLTGVRNSRTPEINESATKGEGASAVALLPAFVILTYFYEAVAATERQP
jgi:hypothetical protein